LFIYLFVLLSFSLAMHLSANTALEKGIVGGLLVGTSSALFMYLNGRITGLSGISKGMVRIDGEDWQYTYNLGLFASGFLAKQLFPHLITVGTKAPQSLPVIITAGLLVGYGTRLGSGCTSGHGLCGLSRYSPRSLVAVLTFMASGAITASIASQPQVAALLTSSTPYEVNNYLMAIAPTLSVLGLSYVYNSTDGSAKPKAPVRSGIYAHLSALMCSLLFGTGLIVGQMVDTERVIGFLDFLNPVRGWDPSLAGVMGGGVLVTALAFPYMKQADITTVVCKRPIKDLITIGPQGSNIVIDAKLVVGASLFGIGWGLMGICPGPGIVSLGLGSAAASLFVPSMLLGMMIRSDYFW
jgi:hypothetical protein